MREGQFRKVVLGVQDFILRMNVDLEKIKKGRSLDSEVNLLLSEVLVFAFFKLKEFKNARSLAQECIHKLQKAHIFAGDHDEVPFPL